MNLFVEGLLNILKNEIGEAPEIFDTIVSIDSPQIINIAILLAKRFKLPLASIRNGP